VKKVAVNQRVTKLRMMLRMCGYLNRKRRYQFFAAIIVLTLPLLSFVLLAAQTPRVGPSFSCQKATTSAEKLICSDRDVSALDLEYSRLYEKRIQESRDKAEIDGIKSNAKFFLQYREHCLNDTVNPGLIKSSEARFKDAERLDADRLGLCYLDLDDGYGPSTWVVNFESMPLDAYAHFVPPINYRGADFGGAQPSDMPGKFTL
jgi:hypothetical protein